MSVLIRVNHELNATLNTLLVIHVYVFENCLKYCIDVVLTNFYYCFDHALLDVKIVRVDSIWCPCLVMNYSIYHLFYKVHMRVDYFVYYYSGCRMMLIELCLSLAEHLSLCCRSTLRFSLFFLSDAFLLLDNLIMAAISALPLTLPRPEIVNSLVTSAALDSDVGSILTHIDLKTATSASSLALGRLDYSHTVVADLSGLVSEDLVLCTATTAVVLATTAMPSFLDCSSEHVYFWLCNVVVSTIRIFSISPFLTPFFSGFIFGGGRSSRRPRCRGFSFCLRYCSHAWSRSRALDVEGCEIWSISIASSHANFGKECVDRVSLAIVVSSNTLSSALPRTGDVMSLYLRGMGPPLGFSHLAYLLPLILLYRRVYHDFVLLLLNFLSLHFLFV